MNWDNNFRRDPDYYDLDERVERKWESARVRRNRERFIWTAAVVLWLAALAIGWVR